jgi:hypothetical protein
MDKPFQRKGSKTNTQVGKDFELKVQNFFAKKGMSLSQNIPIPIGITTKKPHTFDLVDIKNKVLIECKAHTWTEGDNVPGAKLTVWNEAMFYFYVAPPGIRKILVVLRDFSSSRNKTLGEYYIQTYPHLIPSDVEVWEFDEREEVGKKIK